MLELWFESKEELSVRKFSVREAMSELFDVNVAARAKNEDLDLEAIVGKPAGFLMMWGKSPQPRVWSGVCSQFATTEAESTGLSTYEIRIAPALWLLTQRVDNRVFEHMTIPAIVTKILDQYKMKYTLKLGEPHDEHEYRIQYGETDFQFVSRLLEEEGISFHFEQVAEGNAYHSELVLADKPQTAAVRAGGPIHFVDTPNRDSRLDYVTKLRVGMSVRPGRVTIRDFDFVRPDFLLTGESDRTKGAEGTYEHYRYAPNAFIKDRKGEPHTATSEETKRAADIAQQSLRRARRRVSFDSNAFDLCPGSVLSVARHPRTDLEPSKRLLVFESHVEGVNDGEWVTHVQATFAADPFRPLQRTPKPMMRGAHSAIVIGHPGEEIHTDELGRVRVQFHWDREGQYDDKASCWVRVSQGWAGSAWGMVALPRVGHEVWVDFFQGDPDQPIVVGRVYNNRTKVPYKLPEHKTKSTWKSSSSPNSDGFSEIMMEDKTGHELVYIQAQKNLSRLVKVDDVERTGVDRLQIVGANRTAIVGAVDSTIVGAKHATAMGTKEGDAPKTFIDMVEQKIAHTTTSATSLIDGADITLVADANLVIQSGGDVIISGSKVKINCEDISASAQSADMKAAARAGKPVGRVLGGIKKAFPAIPAAVVQGAWKELAVPHRVQLFG